MCIDVKYYVAKCFGFLMPKEKRRTWRYQIEAMKLTTFIENGKERKPKFEEMRGITVFKNKGKNNKIIMHMPRGKFHLSIMFVGDNHVVEVGKQVFGDLNVLVHAGCDSYVSIGDNTSFGDATFHLQSNGRIIIGKKCMFSIRIEVWSTDGHAILDAKTKKTINQNENEVVVGDHCWIGAHTIIYKNAIVPNNTIVGIGSLVTKKFTDEYTAIAGHPAKVIKTGLDWDTKTVEAYNAEFGKK